MTALCCTYAPGGGLVSTHGTVHIDDHVRAKHPEMADLVQLLTAANPADRPSADDALRHAFFASCSEITESENKRVAELLAPPPPSAAVAPGFDFLQDFCAYVEKQPVDRRTLVLGVLMMHLQQPGRVWTLLSALLP